MSVQRACRCLMEKLIAYCRLRGTRRLVGAVLRDNTRMLRFTGSLGFARHRSEEADVVTVELVLQP